jgi:hypothetical protein
MAFRNQAELDAFAVWGERQKDLMGEHVRSAGLFSGDVVGKAVWTLPHRIFIGRAWPKGDSTRAWWIITGELVPTDHLEGQMAETAREAARHFALKWQLQSARMGEMAEAPADAAQKAGTVEWRAVADTLRTQAEGLYSLVENADAWKATTGPLVEDPQAGGAARST